MAKIDSDFRQRLESEPAQQVDIIARITDDPRDRLSDVAAHGLIVRHTYSLVKALAASGPSTAVLALAGEPWVTKIEPDEEVRTMGEDSPAA